MEQQQLVQAAAREAVIAAAREIMGLQKYCALVTIDPSGLPQIRTMNPFPPEDDMSVWMATNSRCKKVAEIRNNPQVCLYYANHQDAVGSVAINGRAVLVDETGEKLRLKRDYWEQAFPDWRYLLLIKVIPQKLSVINYQRGMSNEETTWQVPTIEFTELMRE